MTSALRIVTPDQEARLQRFTERQAVRNTMVYGYESTGGGVVNRQDHIVIVEDTVDEFKGRWGGKVLTSSTAETFNAEEKYFSDRGYVDRGGNWDYNGPMVKGEAQYRDDGFINALEDHEPQLSEFVDLMVELGTWQLSDISGHYEEELPVAAQNQEPKVETPMIVSDPDPVIVSDPEPKEELYPLPSCPRPPVAKKKLLVVVIDRIYDAYDRIKARFV